MTDDYHNEDFFRKYFPKQKPAPSQDKSVPVPVPVPAPVSSPVPPNSQTYSFSKGKELIWTEPILPLSLLLQFSESYTTLPTLNKTNLKAKMSSIGSVKWSDWSKAVKLIQTEPSKLNLTEEELIRLIPYIEGKGKGKSTDAATIAYVRWWIIDHSFSLWPELNTLLLHTDATLSS